MFVFLCDSVVYVFHDFKSFTITLYIFQALSVHYLNILVDNLCCIGFHHLCLPVTGLLRSLAKCVIENELLVKLFHWRLVEVIHSVANGYLEAKPGTSRAQRQIKHT